MSKNRCVAQKGEDLPLNISVAIEFVFLVLFNHYGSERIEVAGASGQADESSISKWYRGPRPYEG